MLTQPNLLQVDLDDIQVQELWETRAAMARLDSWEFIKYFAHTKDEHDPLVVYKPFPMYGCLRVMDRIIKEIPIIYLEKTRQMKLTWFFVAETLHDAMFKNARLIADQSENQDKANGIIGRQTHMYEGLLPFAPLFEATEPFPYAKEIGGKVGTGRTLSFPMRKSEIMAIPQGEDAVQSFTWSWIIADEINLQPKSGEGYAAAMPAISGGGKWNGIGTPNGRTWGYWIREGCDYQTGRKLGANTMDSKLIKLKPIEAPEHYTTEAKRYWIEKRLLEMTTEEFYNIPLEDLVACCPGMRIWKNENGITCVSLHYTADPAKDPATEVGKEWYKNERSMYTRAQWGRHYEIQYDTYLGRPVIPNFERPLFVREPKYDSDSTLYLSCDFGTQVCGAFFAQYKKIPNFNEKRLSLIDEIVLKNSSTPELAAEILEYLQSRFYRSWYNNSFKVFCDPAGNQGKETTSDKSLNTSIKIFQKCGLYPRSKKFGVPESTDVLETVFSLVLTDGLPAIEIHERCDYAIGTCINLHYPEKGRSGYYEKDGWWDHGGDQWRYLVNNIFTSKSIAPPVERPQEMVQRFKHRRYTGEIIGVQNRRYTPRNRIYERSR